MRTYFALIGLLCLAGAIWLMMRRLRVRLFGMTAQGTVVGHEVREIDESSTYLPVVSFRDQRGVECRFTSVAGWTSKLPPVGTRLLVRYLPSNPRLAYIGTFLHMWAAPLAAFVLGMAGMAALWY